MAGFPSTRFTADSGTARFDALKNQYVYLSHTRNDSNLSKGHFASLKTSGSAKMKFYFIYTVDSVEDLDKTSGADGKAEPAKRTKDASEKKDAEEEGE